MIRSKPGLWTVLLLLLPLIAGAEEPPVVVSIKPIHALVAGVMQGVAEPELLIKGGASPHDYSLRPSDVRQINQAQVVFWIGEDLESFLKRPLANSSARSVELMETPGLHLLAMREGGAWEPHVHHHDDQEDHNEHDHHEHKDKEHKDYKDHDHDPEKKGHGHHEHDDKGHEDHGHAEHENHGHQHRGAYDAHIWLDPQNAMLMVRHISTVLSEIDPAHGDTYKQNSAELIQHLEELDRELATKLTPIQDVPYFVFHDAYQYFERRYGLNAAGSIVVSPEHLPRTRRVRDIRQRISADEARCVFSEPQFQPALVEVLVEGTGARSSELDPLGAELPAGPESYFQLLHNLATSLNDCLAAEA